MSHTRTIKLLRVSKNLTQEQVAAALQISIPAYSKIETGITDINLSRLKQLAEFYGVTPQSLISGEAQTDAEVIIDALKSEVSEYKDALSALQTKVIDLYGQLHAV